MKLLNKETGVYLTDDDVIALAVSLLQKRTTVKKKREAEMAFDMAAYRRKHCLKEQERMLFGMAANRLKHRQCQQELAERRGSARQLVSMIEIGRRRITPDTAAHWEGEMGVKRERLNRVFLRRPNKKA